MTSNPSSSSNTYLNEEESIDYNDDNNDVVNAVRDYAKFLTNTLTPRLRILVTERDSIREQIRGLHDLCSNSALYCNAPSSPSSPPPQPQKYLTRTSPTTYSLRESPSSAPGVLLNVGLDFYVHLTTPSEINRAAEGRVEVLKEKLEVTEREVERTRIDTENIIGMIEQLGGEMKEG